MSDSDGTQEKKELSTLNNELEKLILLQRIGAGGRYGWLRRQIKILGLKIVNTTKNENNDKLASLLVDQDDEWLEKLYSVSIREKLNSRLKSVPEGKILDPEATESALAIANEEYKNLMAEAESLITENTKLEEETNIFDLQTGIEVKELQRQNEELRWVSRPTTNESLGTRFDKWKKQHLRYVIETKDVQVGPYGRDKQFNVQEAYADVKLVIDGQTVYVLQAIRRYEAIIKQLKDEINILMDRNLLPLSTSNQLFLDIHVELIKDAPHRIRERRIARYKVKVKLLLENMQDEEIFLRRQIQTYADLIATELKRRSLPPIILPTVPLQKLKFAIFALQKSPGEHVIHIRNLTTKPQTLENYALMSKSTFHRWKNSSDTKALDLSTKTLDLSAKPGKQPKLLREGGSTSLDLKLKFDRPRDFVVLVHLPSKQSESEDFVYTDYHS